MINDIFWNSPKPQTIFEKKRLQMWFQKMCKNNILQIITNAIINARRKSKQEKIISGLDDNYRFEFSGL